MSIYKKKIKKMIEISVAVIGAAFIGMSILAKKKKSSSIYEDDKEQKNPFEGKKVVLIKDENDKENVDGVRGHLEAVGDTDYQPSFYEKRVKRAIDVVLSFGGLVMLWPVFATIALAIKIEDPGSVLFTQKRVGQNKKYFKLHKFRSMKMSTPHDVPTHQLENPEQYITKVGKFIRKHSLDELPQIWDIFVGNMSVIGPRPALWNQDLLTAERDKYNANDVKPGLTGWAQINGRDELEIPDKAKLDGEYVKKMGLGMDIKCFLGSLHVFGKDESVVEGGTGEKKKEEQRVPKDPGDTFVSVVMSSYRRSDTLRKALLSLASQTYKNFEVVLIDDNADSGWTEKVRQIVDDMEGKITIKYIVNEENLGSSASRNRGIFMAQGEYITFLDDDDIYLPEKIERQLADLISTQADYGITDLFLYDENEKLIDKRVRSYIKDTDKKSLMRYHLIHHMTGTDTFMFRTEYIRKIGGFPDIDVGDEFYLMEKAILGEGKFTYFPHCDIKAYVHTGEYGGLSSGQKKITGENILYANKQRYFNELDEKEKKYIKARHYAVIAFAEMRRKNVRSFVRNVLAALIVSPIACIKILSEHK
ncbi:sugar transferase [Eubacterium sp. ER2]|uniref:sugar transferase n=1 Tax=Eubacterium sp. ER2 TaxID=1519438 RepID=UPI0009DF59A3|nr:sugar transferase [Eubacterium sp. ER2]